jgi:hypothetical protein
MCLRQPFGSAITALAQTHWHADLFDWISAKFGDDNNVNWRQQANCARRHLRRDLYLQQVAENRLLGQMPGNVWSAV